MELRALRMDDSSLWDSHVSRRKDAAAAHLPPAAPENGRHGSRAVTAKEGATEAEGVGLTTSAHFQDKTWTALVRYFALMSGISPKNPERSCLKGYLMNMTREGVRTSEPRFINVG